MAVALLFFLREKRNVLISDGGEKRRVCIQDKMVPTCHDPRSTSVDTAQGPEQVASMHSGA